MYKRQSQRSNKWCRCVHSCAQCSARALLLLRILDDAPCRRTAARWRHSACTAIDGGEVRRAANVQTFGRMSRHSGVEVLMSRSRCRGVEVSRCKSYWCLASGCASRSTRARARPGGPGWRNQRSALRAIMLSCSRTTCASAAPTSGSAVLGRGGSWEPRAHGAKRCASRSTPAGETQVRRARVHRTSTGPCTPRGHERTMEVFRSTFGNRATDCRIDDVGCLAARRRSAG